MSDTLDTFSDAELSEVFAREVAGWVRTDRVYDWQLPDGRILQGEVPIFAESVDALLPFIGVRSLQILRTLASSWNVWIASVGDVNAPTLPRALCISLILAARLELEKDRARHRSEVVRGEET